MRIRNMMDSDTYGSIQGNPKSYATCVNAEKAALKWLGGFGESWDCTASIIVTQNDNGRYLPVLFFQGRDGAQACINSAHQGFSSFA